MMGKDTLVVLATLSRLIAEKLMNTFCTLHTGLTTGLQSWSRGRTLKRSSSKFLEDPVSIVGIRLGIGLCAVNILRQAVRPYISAG